MQALFLLALWSRRLRCHVSNIRLIVQSPLNWIVCADPRLAISKSASVSVPHLVSG